MGLTGSPALISLLQQSWMTSTTSLCSGGEQASLTSCQRSKAKVRKRLRTIWASFLCPWPDLPVPASQAQLMTRALPLGQNFFFFLIDLSSIFRNTFLCSEAWNKTEQSLSVMFKTGTLLKNPHSSCSKTPKSWQVPFLWLLLEIWKLQNRFLLYRLRSPAELNQGGSLRRWRKQGRRRECRVGYYSAECLKGGKLAIPSGFANELVPMDLKWPLSYTLHQRHTRRPETRAAIWKW